MLFCEVSGSCFPWPGESLLKAVEYQPSGHRASLQLWNFCPVSLIEPLPSLQVSKEERGGRTQWERFSPVLDDSRVSRQWLTEAQV